MLELNGPLQMLVQALECGDSTVRCPWHGSQFNVCTGAVLQGPAKDPLKTYRVTVDGDVGRVEVPLAQAVQGA